MKFIAATIKATIKDAEKVMTENGFTDFTFTGASYTNGASFYFTLCDNRKVRVSDHPLTGNRAFDVIQLSLFKVKEFTSKASNLSTFKLTKEMIEAAAKRKSL